MMVFLLSAIGRLKALKTAYDAHVAASGASVHNLGTMSTQNKGGVDVDGGAIDGTPIGASAVETIDGKRVREAVNDMGSGTSFALDWAAYGGFKISPSNNFSVTHNNKPAAGKIQVIFVDVYFSGSTYTPTWTGVTWKSGSAPTLATGHNWIMFWVADGSIIWGNPA